MHFFRKTANNRHLTQIALGEALQQRGCAFCCLARQHAQRALEVFFQEALIDVAQRDAWRAARGLCNWHAWLAVEMPHNASNLAILYQDVLQHDVQTLAHRASEPARRWRWRRSAETWFQRLLHFWKHRPPCSLCRVWQEHEQMYEAVLLDDWYAAAFADVFRVSGGLCWPHLLHLCERQATHRHLAHFLSVQQHCLSQVQGELQEFLRKQDYRFAREPYGQEADVWQRVVGLYCGTKGWLGERRR